MKDIIKKYLGGLATAKEQLELLAWLRNKENRRDFNSHKLDWKKNSESHVLPEGSEKSWLAIQDQMLQKSYSGWQHSRNMSQIFRIAAVFFFIISLGSAVYFISEKPTSLPEYYTNVVADNGQISKVELPDGSEVWLNSGSKISYNNFFAATNRDITLEGEAYFQISKNENLPLLVNSGDIQIKVLGTRFNVAAYPETENIDVVLESGKVELLSPEVESFQYFLEPGEKASFHKETRKLGVSEVNTLKFTSWKDGMINIYNQPLEELVERLEKRYNQKFEYAEALKGYHFTFTIKNEPLDEIIHIMEKIAPIKAEQKKEVIVFKIDKMKERELSR